MNIPANVLTPLSRQSVFNNKRFADLYARLCEIVLKLSREKERKRGRGKSGDETTPGNCELIHRYALAIQRNF